MRKLFYAGSGTYTSKQIDVYVKSENANGILVGFDGWQNWVDVEIKGQVYRFQYWNDVVVVRKPQSIKTNEEVMDMLDNVADKLVKKNMEYLNGKENL